MMILNCQIRRVLLVLTWLRIRETSSNVIASGLSGAHVMSPNFQSSSSMISPACREPFIQPFAGSSIWNTPIGTNARFVKANLYAEFNTTIFHVDTEYMIGFSSYRLAESIADTSTSSAHHSQSISEAQGNVATLIPVINQGWWGGVPAAAAAKCPSPSSSNSWCHCTVIGNVSDHLPIPLDFITNTTGNNEGTVKLNDTHVLQLQPVYRCGTTPTSPLLALWSPFMRNPEHHRILDVRTSNGTYGCHGGSGLSGFGMMRVYRSQIDG